MVDIESKIISYREDTNDYRLCLTREEITEINQALTKREQIRAEEIYNDLIDISESAYIYTSLQEKLNKYKQLKEQSK